MAIVIYCESFPGLDPPIITTSFFKTVPEALKKFYSMINEFITEHKEDFDEVKNYTKPNFYKRILESSRTDDRLFSDDPSITSLMKQYFRIEKTEKYITFDNQFGDVHYQFKCEFL